MKKSFAMEWFDNEFRMRFSQNLKRYAVSGGASEEDMLNYRFANAVLILTAEEYSPRSKEGKALLRSLRKF